MILKDGHYELTLDLSSCPQLKNANWQFPDKNWSFTQGPGENEITFLYTGEEPSGRISAGNVEGLDDRYYAYIFIRESLIRCRWAGWICSVPRQKYGLKQERGVSRAVRCSL